MHILAVHLTVKPDRIAEFKQATFANAAGSRTEPGIISFDLLQDKEHPEQFMLYEVYVEQKDHAAHRETAHYKAWKAATADLIAENGARGIFDYAEKT